MVVPPQCRRTTMATFKFGNKDGLFVDATNTNNDTFIVGNGVGDAVAASNTHDDTIIVGNGSAEVACGFGISSAAFSDTITLGYGADLVFLGLAARNTITLGEGVGDQVIIAQSAENTIALGNGAGDSVQLFFVFSTFEPFSLMDTITLGNGDNDSVEVGPSPTSRGSQDT